MARLCVGYLPLWPGWTPTVREIARRKVDDLSEHDAVVEGLARVCAEAAEEEWEELRLDEERLLRVRTAR